MKVREARSAEESEDEVTKPKNVGGRKCVLNTEQSAQRSILAGATTKEHGKSDGKHATSQGECGPRASILWINTQVEKIPRQCRWGCAGCGAIRTCEDNETLFVIWSKGGLGCCARIKKS
jgi:hypothetical protein